MGTLSNADRARGSLTGFARTRGPGFLVSAVEAVAAQFLSEHYGAPAIEVVSTSQVHALHCPDDRPI
jgi:hypothetical protein